MLFYLLLFDSLCTHIHNIMYDIFFLVLTYHHVIQTLSTSYTYSDAPQFNNNVTTLIFTVGEKATLDCSVDSNAAATIIIVTPSGISVNISSDGIFVISKITSDKAGTYVCTANNSLGDVMLSYTVDVGCK